MQLLLFTVIYFALIFFAVHPINLLMNCCKCGD
uniref:Uncharacterized protein n=1 Tax=Anguilla anguilla TaxID=7936 RepID=A0A0E9PFT6_ANGAN